MSNPRFHPNICGVCGKPAVGLGHAPKNCRSANQILWTCGDRECISIAQRSYNMSQQEFARLDAVAAHKAGDKAGAYLDSIGKTDLANLTTEEWFKFLETVVGSYRDILKNELDDETPF